ncbi:MAG: hypothetical protein JWO31_1732 [Phycisphaerales bacterium]|nr:hypothetical protein [Phycisphaerales bacterium]
MSPLFRILTALVSVVAGLALSMIWWAYATGDWKVDRPYDLVLSVLLTAFSLIFYCLFVAIFLAEAA